MKDLTPPVLIWYNPDADLYEKGYMAQYANTFLASANWFRFDIVYEFRNEEMHLVSKTLSALNKARTRTVDKLALSVV